MRQLSVKQPWASMIADGHKTIETRTWATPYRGLILVCASKRPSNMGPAGVALCVAYLVECRRLVKADRPAALCYGPDLWAWVLADVRRVAPFPVEGRLGLRPVAPEVARRVRCL